MPAERAASSRPSVKTRWPFFADTIAVPVSWHMGSTPPAAMLAFFSSSSATKRSLSEASGSSRIFASCSRWPGRSRWLMSMKACSESISSALGSTVSTSSPRKVSTETYWSVSLR